MEQVILVTGASDRVGRAIALQVASQGATVAVHYHHSKEKAQETVRQITTLGGRAKSFQSNIGILEDVQRLQQEITASLGSVTAIVNNAAFTQMKSFFDYKPNEWQQELDVCLNGVIHLAYVFLPQMKEINKGKFITLIGDSARTGDRKLIISAAARSGVISLMKSLAQEIGRYQIQCNTISIGLLDQGDLHFSPDVQKQILKGYPLQRLGTVDDVTGVVAFLLSDAANWITGQVLSVNGGHSMLS
ncbi:SDR family NAD(P)-dependent oxidoreductase [Lysinibacillus sp. NPDC097231]|uniref:SDR family NAD(P)-dependent oxidoreductase n=1 Tax=Lysinibacillus sp. NPDC097231 TaxID=3364142 RepID=UPI003830A732